MNHSVISMSILQFALVYLLLIVVLFIMKKAQIDKSKLLIVASIRMTAQLVLVGFILQYILGNPRPIFTVMFLAVMLVFSIYRIYNTRPDLNRRFKVAVAVSLCFSGLAVLGYFVAVVVGVDVFNPQYTIPLAGMIIGNAMTGVTLGLKTFMEGIKAERKKIETLMNLGIDFKTILQPFVNNALENALLPTINSMLGMGIIFCRA
jgi:putative ABC transport system permease protein